MEETEIENRMRDLRREMTLSQEELAEALGISRQSIIALEQGRYLPSLPLAVSICQFFDRAFEEIFCLAQSPENEYDEDDKVKIKVSKSAKAALREESDMDMLEPWRPFRESISLRDAVDRLLSDSVITPRTAGPAMPKVDIKERKEDFLIKAELPGLAEEEVDVEVSSDGIVTISGEKQEEKEEKEEGYHYHETFSGAFSRSFSLPADVVADKAAADMEQGVLTITIPKAKPEKVQKLKVSTKKKE